MGQSTEGWYETNFGNKLWKDGYPHISSNKSGSLERLNNLIRNLSQYKQFETYDSINRRQSDSGIVDEGWRKFLLSEKRVLLAS